MSKINPPTFVANGDNDVMVASSQSRVLAERILNAKLAIYPTPGTAASSSTTSSSSRRPGLPSGRRPDRRMKAYVVDRYKGPLTLADLPEPTVGEHDVLVDIHAAGVNGLDAKLRSGEFKLVLPYKTLFALGHDLAGVVAQTGAKVTRFAVGDEVFGRARDGRIGTFAQRLAVHDDLARKPGGLSMPEAASVPLVALTAWQALVELAQVRPGQKVLIHAGSGGWARTPSSWRSTSAPPWPPPPVPATSSGYESSAPTPSSTTRPSSFDELLGLRRRTGLPGRRHARQVTARPQARGLAIGIAGPPDPDFARRQGVAYCGSRSRP